ncbi:hypothetical protein BDW22DRAFT_1360862 [Trametopsis cervina]|nr:hypothetical protein BDW22DRAFT_1360862 [Trametopsis cervina]
MDSLIATGAGLGLRALINAVAHQTVQATALVGLWEGVVLNHFMGKLPYSTDPYLAFGFRLFLDFLFTESFMRVAIIVLWTGLGMLLADVAVQVSLDRRFRRLWRRITRSRSTTALSPDSQTLRPTTTPVPGQFDQWSVVSGASRLEPESTTSSDSASQTPTDADDAVDAAEVVRPRTPSELEYLTLPVIPDTTGSTPLEPLAAPPPPPSRPPINVDVTPRNSYTPKSTKPAKPTKLNIIHDNDDIPAVNSGLTTPTSNPRSNLDEEDRPRIHSGLTTPEHLHTPLKMPMPDVPSSSSGPLKRSIPPRLTLAASSPTVALSETQLTPMVIPPASEIPNIPTPDDPLLARSQANRTPPPSFQEAIKAGSVADDDASSVGQESVIVGKRNEIIAKADELRKLARDAEAERDRLRNELRKAEREKRYLDIVCLQVEYEEAQENINQLHTKAARRYYKAHNLNPAPQEIDVHRLNTDEALVQVKKAIRDARGFGATQLRIIVGKGKHSKDNVPVLKPAVISELQKLHIATEEDKKNAGVLVVKLPAGKFSAAGPTS